MAFQLCAIFTPLGGRLRGADVEEGASARFISYLNGGPDRAIGHCYTSDSATLDRKSPSAATTRQVTMEIRVRFGRAPSRGMTNRLRRLLDLLQLALDLLDRAEIEGFARRVFPNS
jgi:hypothetical protein